MLTLHGDNRSGNCLKVKWMLNALGRDYRWVEVDIMSGASRTDAFLKLNPFGQVPVLVDVFPNIRRWIGRVETAFGIA